MFGRWHRCCFGAASEDGVAVASLLHPSARACCRQCPFAGWGESLLYFGFLQFFWCCYFCSCCFLIFSIACSFYYDYRDTRALHRIVAYLSAAAAPLSLSLCLLLPSASPTVCCLCVWSASGVANLCCCCNCLLFNCTPHAASSLLHVAYI